MYISPISYNAYTPNFERKAPINIPKAKMIECRIENKMNIANIAEFFNVSKAKIQSSLKEYGLTIKNPLPKSELISLARTKYTVEQIAEIYNIPTPQIYDKLKKYRLISYFKPKNENIIEENIKLEEIIVLINQGVKHNEIAKMYGMSPSQFLNYKIKNDLIKKRTNPNVIEEVLSNMKSEINIKRIIKKTGLDYKTVKAWLKKNKGIDNLTEQKTKLRRELFEQNLSDEEIAKRLNICVKYVKRLRRDLGYV